ncbi:MAG: hypothetical protein KBD63_05785 [Bacteriovoracaceae bacterium]|nr:hypothetical protein [Bacteriovoracaceae bacterium]
MQEIIKHYLEDVLKEYTRNEHLESSILAKKYYFDITGTIAEEEPDYEAKMHLFNEWYIFDYVSPRAVGTVMRNYLEQRKIEDDIAMAFLSVNYSLFEYVKNTFKGFVVLHDILHDKKIILTQKAVDVPLVKGDLFVGRVLTYKNEISLLRGIWSMPTLIKKILVKESKRIRKLKDPLKEKEFLLKLELYKTKWMHYRHVLPERIFIF